MSRLVNLLVAMCATSHSYPATEAKLLWNVMDTSELRNMLICSLIYDTWKIKAGLLSSVHLFLISSDPTSFIYLLIRDHTFLNKYVRA